MPSTDISPKYAKVGGPPRDWSNLTIRQNGERITDVIEVDCVQGWAIVLKRDASGKFVQTGDGLLKEKIFGEFTLSYEDDD